ncbi:hypothetical protein [Actomonas aquatica]|uniref:Spore coat protein U domain-containing protein n=1 Tax=Actomonas aquatica TaxID=2866162 RepID=A0ABZ1C2H4_9BACT|nr:hypothetical protein [Opitutus sp. WL0086]WRQ85729.1 hypothetical protein K1X11_013030 [Opitutus sp. WL0086]
MKKISALVLAFSSVIGVFGQSSNFVLLTDKISSGGGSVSCELTFEYSGKAISTLGVNINLPEGWSYVGASGENLPSICPVPGSTEAAEFAYLNLPADRFSYRIDLRYPAGLSNFSNIEGAIIYKLRGERDLVSIEIVAVSPTPPKD